MQIISDIKEIKRLTRRGQRRTVLQELRRRGIHHEVAHDGWPVVYIADDAPQRATKPNLSALRKT